MDLDTRRAPGLRAAARRADRARERADRGGAAGLSDAARAAAAGAVRRPHQGRGGSSRRWETATETLALVAERAAQRVPRALVRARRCRVVGLDLRVAFVNMRRAARALAAGQRPRRAPRAPSGPNLIEPLLGMAGTLAGVFASPLNGMLFGHRRRLARGPLVGEGARRRQLADGRAAGMTGCGLVAGVGFLGLPSAWSLFASARPAAASSSTSSARSPSSSSRCSALWEQVTRAARGGAQPAAAGAPARSATAWRRSLALLLGTLRRARHPRRSAPGADAHRDRGHDRAGARARRAHHVDRRRRRSTCCSTSSRAPTGAGAAEGGDGRRRGGAGGDRRRARPDLERARQGAPRPRGARRGRGGVVVDGHRAVHPRADDRPSDGRLRALVRRRAGAVAGAWGSRTVARPDGVLRLLGILLARARRAVRRRGCWAGSGCRRSRRSCRRRRACRRSCRSAPSSRCRDLLGPFVVRSARARCRCPRGARARTTPAERVRR